MQVIVRRLLQRLLRLTLQLLSPSTDRMHLLQCHRMRQDVAASATTIAVRGNDALETAVAHVKTSVAAAALCCYTIVVDHEPRTSPRRSEATSASDLLTAISRSSAHHPH